MNKSRQVEPWLRGTLSELPAVQRAVIHALQLAEEDLNRWCADLTREEFNVRPAEVASVAFHIQHIARSVDRLLTYAEGRSLSEAQWSGLSSELAPDAEPSLVFQELRIAVARAMER